MNKPNVLIVADKKDAEILDTERQSEHWNIFWEIIDYNELHKKVSEIRKSVTKNDVDFVLYSRNDQVANRISIGPVTRKLRTGYSSFSGIDKKDRIAQMKACFETFINCDKRLDFNVCKRKGNLSESNFRRGTFSLIFDTEQIGGVKYGLPRILDLLTKYDVRATFFVTNLMKKVFPNILEEIRGQGHEVGLHGIWHEYLSDLDEEEQRQSIQNMIQDFGGEVRGANFMGRMNKDTLQALIEKEIKYFVHPLINYYHFTNYPKLPTTPGLISFSDKNIWMLPVSVETYEALWFSIKNMIDSAISQSKKCGFLHISILCHPFRDGNLANIETTEKLLYYLIKKELRPITLKELVNKLPHSRDFPNINKIEDLFKPKKAKTFLPQNKQDYFSMIPENLMMIYRIIKRGHAVF